MVAQAEAGCFAANNDDDLDRRALRNDAAPRLDAKIEALRGAPAAAAATAAAGGRRRTATAARIECIRSDADTSLRLNPGGGDPLDRLRQILQDAAARGGG